MSWVLLWRPIEGAFALSDIKQIKDWRASTSVGAAYERLLGAIKKMEQQFQGSEF